MNRSKEVRRLLVLAVVAASVVFTSQGMFAQDQKGIELFNAGRFHEAETVFRETLKANPSDMSSTYYLGLAVLQQKNYKDALDLFVKIKQSRTERRAKTAIPTEYQIQLATARARIGLKQFSEAWKNLEAAQKEDGSASDVHVYRGVYYLEQEKHEDAIRELERAIKLDSRNPYAYYYAGIGYYHSGNGQKAVEDLKMFLQLAPDAPEAAEAKEIIDKLC